MAWTASDIAAVEAAIRALIDGSPVQSYALADGRNVAYISLDDLRKLRSEMRREVEAATSGGLPLQYIVPERSR